MSDLLKELLKRFLSDDTISDFSELKRELEKPENIDVLKDLPAIKHLFLQSFEVDKEKMWSKISQECRVARRRQIIKKSLRYVAVLMPLLLIAGGLWYFFSTQPTKTDILPLATTTYIEPGKKQAIIWIDNEEYVDISNIAKDTTIQREGYSIKLSPEGSISYEHDSKVTIDTGSDEVVSVIKMNTIFIPRGGEYYLTLPDGSQVWLNSDTELHFPVFFQGKERRIKLNGEAYFNVVNDPTKPFIVETENIALQVLGTKFNIKGHRNEPVQATLLEGSVRIDYGENNNTILTPGQQFAYYNGQSKVSEVDAEMYTSWIRGRFCFDSTSLKEITLQMERWYDINFVFTDESLKEEKFTGVIERDSSANNVMDIINKIIDIQYDIKGRTIYLFRKKH